MQVDRDVNSGGKESSFKPYLKEAIADAIELVVDGVRVELAKVVQKRLSDRISDTWVDFNRSGTIQLDYFPAGVGELSIESDGR